MFRFRMAFSHPVNHQVISLLNQSYFCKQNFTRDRILIDEVMTWPVEVLMMSIDEETCHYIVPTKVLRHYWTPVRNNPAHENVADWRWTMMMTGD